MLTLKDAILSVGLIAGVPLEKGFMRTSGPVVHTVFNEIRVSHVLI